MRRNRLREPIGLVRHPSWGVGLHPADARQRGGHANGPTFGPRTHTVPTRDAHVNGRRWHSFWKITAYFERWAAHPHSLPEDARPRATLPAGAVREHKEKTEAQTDNTHMHMRSADGKPPTKVQRRQRPWGERSEPTGRGARRGRQRAELAQTEERRARHTMNWEGMSAYGAPTPDAVGHPPY